MKRIAIIGGSGAGKTTLARKIGRVLGLPVHHIDKFYWLRPWEKRSEPEFTAMTQAALAQEAWVFDGFPGKNRNTSAQTLDMMIFIDEPYFKRLWRVIARCAQHRKAPDEDIAETCAGLLTVRYIRSWLFGWHFKAHWRCKTVLMSTPPNVTRVHLKGTREVDAFLADLGAQAGQVREDAADGRLDSRALHPRQAGEKP